MTNLTKTIIDFAFTTHGTVTLIEMQTDRAREFAPDHFDMADLVTLGSDTIPCEPRFAANIAQDLYFEQGFNVSINGRVCDAERECAT